MTDKIILASGSPRRFSLLTNYGFDVTVIKPDFDESNVFEGIKNLATSAKRLAEMFEK